MKNNRDPWRSGAVVACEKIGRAIISGRFPENSRLPHESELADEFKISRNTLREAMKALAGKSLIDIAPRRGTIVLPKEQWNNLDRDALEWAGSIFKGDPIFMQELFQMRQILEPGAAVAAADNATEQDIVQIQMSYQQMATAISMLDSEEWVKADLAFHNAIFSASHNRFIQSTANIVFHAFQFNFRLIAPQPDSFALNLENHRLLSEAIVRRDSAGAREATENMLLRNREDALRAITDSSLVPASETFCTSLAADSSTPTNGGKS